MRKNRMKTFGLVLLILCSLATGVCSCKAWRTVSTSATYIQQSDSAQSKTTTTISTKTTEEYVGTRKK